MSLGLRRFDGSHNSSWTFCALPRALGPRWLMLSVLVAALCGSVASARAEPNLDPRVAIKLDPEPSAPPPALLDDVQKSALRRDVRRARAMLMAGTGLLAASAFTLGRLTGHCLATDRPMRGPLIAGGVSAGLGAAVLLGGGIKLALVPRAQRHRLLPLTPRRVTGLVLGGLAIGAVTTAMAFLASAPDYIGCD
jgi:hypothetical protein